MEIGEMNQINGSGYQAKIVPRAGQPASAELIRWHQEIRYGFVKNSDSRYSGLMAARQL